ncbi:MAG: DUF4126 domain-containing protein, partial [Candidatus Thiodiazotropha sp. (ex Gloverina cf. vestifex)]|nr:DUF4126 domain-containing protein [Candidatus Thiodiazotropha sp. (ex Gloverina cf. vestifex)]
METIETLALTLGAGWAAGINLYAAILVLGYMGMTGHVTLHTFIRIPAGALLAAGAASGFEVNQAAELTAALVGGTLAAGSHFTKAGSRLMINTSPEPVTNWTASVVQACRYLVKDFGTSESPKSTRQRDSRYAPT